MSETLKLTQDLSSPTHGSSKLIKHICKMVNMDLFTLVWRRKSNIKQVEFIVRISNFINWSENRCANHRFFFRNVICLLHGSINEVHWLNSASTQVKQHRRKVPCGFAARYQWCWIIILMVIPGRENFLCLTTGDNTNVVWVLTLRSVRK